MKARVQAALDELRPFIQADGGDVELVSVEGDVVTVRLTGHCVGCPSSSITLRAGIERHLKQKIPEIREIVQAPAEPQQAPAHGPMVSPFANSVPVAAPAVETVTSHLRAAHRKAEEVLSEMDAALDAIGAGSRAPELLKTLERAEQYFRDELWTHMRQEDEVLFPALIPFISWGSPMSVMAKEHRSLSEEFSAFKQAHAEFKAGGEPATLVRLGKRISQHLRDDFYQEENVLFVEADESLTGSRAQALREAMDRIAKAAARSAE